MNTKKITNLVSIFVVIILVAGITACEQLQRFVRPVMPSEAHTEGSRVLNVGFYAYFSLVSYSASADPAYISAMKQTC